MSNYIPSDLTQTVKEDYLAYSMAVLIGRALPRLEDGMKPVSRRILAAMRGLGLKPEGRYMKCARIEGEVMGRYHPHGSAYGALVTLASPWNNILPLVDGHGNLGSSTDKPAASRYTEAKLTPFAWDAMLQDSDIWETLPNYDGSLQEPTVLNVAVPTVLLNGIEGIGVGYATKIAPHNLRDICEAVVKGGPLRPDFPTGCDIVRDEELTNYLASGSGNLRLRAKMESGTQVRAGKAKDRVTLSFTNLPPNTNPEKLGEEIKNELEKGRINGISEVVDESDRSGDRLTVVAKPGIDIELLARQLYGYTSLDSRYSAKTLVVYGGKPCEFSTTEIIARWKEWRLDVLERKFVAERDTGETRLEILQGYLKAIDKIDAVIKVIRAAESSKEAIIELVSNRVLKFTSSQARAILEMKLRALTNLDAGELKTEEAGLIKRLEELGNLIKDTAARTKYMMAEIKAIGVRHGEARRSSLIDPPMGITKTREPGSKAPAAVAKPRFLKIDMKRGVIEQARGPRGAMLLERTDKLVVLTEDGTLKKVASNFKGPIADNFYPVCLAKKESDVASRKYLLVFTLEDQLKAVAIDGADLCRVTSKGKNALPPGAELKYFGEGSYTVPWVSPRKKKVELFPVSTKKGKPGAKGVKVANVGEINLS
jgi:DNA gyrase subunit A